MNLEVPLNFLSSVVQLLSNPTKYTNEKIDASMLKATQAFGTCFDNSVKLILPENGLLMDKSVNREGYGKYMRMPFPMISGIYRTISMLNEGAIITWLAIDPAMAWGRDEEHIIFFALLHSRVNGEFRTHLSLVKETLSPTIEVPAKTLPFIAYLHNLDGAAFTDTDPTFNSFIDQLYTNAVGSLVDVLLAFNIERGVRYEDLPTTPEISAKLNKKRRSRGKAPLYQYRILDLNAERVVYNHDKTAVHTHASPRAHMRRAHIRHLEDKAVWVRECMVNAGVWEQVTPPVYIGRNKHA